MDARLEEEGLEEKDGKPVLNVELMQAIDSEMQGRSVRFEWVKGHAGNEMNEAADERARAAATAYQKGTAPNEGPGFTGATSGAGAGQGAARPGAGRRFRRLPASSVPCGSTVPHRLRASARIPISSIHARAQ